MNWRNLKQGRMFIRTWGAILVVFSTQTAKAWEIDLSRRQSVLRSKELSKETAPIATLDGLEEQLDGGEPSQEVVILNTKAGFVPKTIRLRTGTKYQIYVVNVNGENKNVSFIMDAFSQYHGTFFGEPKVFLLTPKKDGLFSFQCPETSEEGRIIVYTATTSKTIRRPASELGRPSKPVAAAQELGESPGDE